MITPLVFLGSLLAKIAAIQAYIDPYVHLNLNFLEPCYKKVTFKRIHAVISAIQRDVYLSALT